MSKSTYIHVNKNRILSWLKGTKKEPVIRFQTGKYGKSTYGDEIAIYDENGREVARFLAKLDGKPLLPCGARVAVKTDLEVRVITRD